MKNCKTLCWLASNTRHISFECIVLLVVGAWARMGNLGIFKTDNVNYSSSMCMRRWFAMITRIMEKTEREKTRRGKKRIFYLSFVMGKDGVALDCKKADDNICTL